MAQLIPIRHVLRTWQNPKKIGHNTTAWNDGQSWGMRYHYTNVCGYDYDTQTLFVSTGGWFTCTTLQRIREALYHVGLELSTHDLPGKWRVMDYKGNAWTIRGNSLKLRRFGDTWERVTNGD
jgi:hypothetical protein